MAWVRRREIYGVYEGRETVDGAGVRLKRVFGGKWSVDLTDPFLLLDEIRSSDPLDYRAGFPWHPHRGIETVTYVLEGKIEHQDSTGGYGVIHRGHVQWMTAGSGIFHQEMPAQPDGLLWGYQLWVNLPAREKFTVPKYRNVTPENIPKAILDSGAVVKVISGRVGDVEGPVRDLAVKVTYADVYVPEDSVVDLTVPSGYTAWLYIIEGAGLFEDMYVTRGQLVVYDRDGELIRVRTRRDKGVRFLFGAGRPLKEPVAWYGPIVMNTWDQIQEALEDLRRGTFVRHIPVTQDVTY